MAQFQDSQDYKERPNSIRVTIIQLTDKGTHRVFYLSLDYNTIKSKQYQGNVGLPMVGEMFSGNDINLTFPATVPKSFVNTDVIENPTAAEYFWMMNPDSNSNPGRALLLHPRGYYTYNPSTWGVRPTLFINKGTSDVLTFKSGNGTAEHPYILGD